MVLECVGVGLDCVVCGSSLQLAAIGTSSLEAQRSQAMLWRRQRKEGRNAMLL